MSGQIHETWWRDWSSGELKFFEAISNSASLPNEACKFSSRIWNEAINLLSAESIPLRHMWTFHNPEDLPEGISWTPLELIFLSDEKSVTPSDFLELLNSWFLEDSAILAENSQEVKVDDTSEITYNSELLQSFCRKYSLKLDLAKILLKALSVPDESIALKDWNKLMELGENKKLSFLGAFAILQNDRSLFEDNLPLISSLLCSYSFSENIRWILNKLASRNKTIWIDLLAQKATINFSDKTKLETIDFSTPLNKKNAKQKLSWLSVYVTLPWYKISIPLFYIVSSKDSFTDLDSFLSHIDSTWLDFLMSKFQDIVFPDKDDNKTKAKIDEFISSLSVEKGDENLSINALDKDKKREIWEFLTYVSSIIKENYLTYSWWKVYIEKTNQRIFDWDRVSKPSPQEFEKFHKWLEESIETLVYDFIWVNNIKISDPNFRIKILDPNFRMSASNSSWHFDVKIPQEVSIDFSFINLVLQEDVTIKSWVDGNNLVLVFEKKDGKKLCIWVNVPWEKYFFEHSPFSELSQVPHWRSEKSVSDYNKAVFNSIDKVTSSNDPEAVIFNILPIESIKIDIKGKEFFSISADMEWVDSSYSPLEVVDKQKDINFQILCAILQKSTSDILSFLKNIDVQNILNNANYFDANSDIEEREYIIVKIKTSLLESAKRDLSKFVW